MKNQFKYALREGVSLRLTTLGAMFAVNAAAPIIFNVFKANQIILTLTMALSSLSCTAVFVTNVIADVFSFQNVFKAPDGYLGALTPVRSYKALFARYACSVAQDCVSLCAAVALTVLQSLFYYTGMSGEAPPAINRADVVFSLGFTGVICIIYAFIFMLVIFALSLKNSVLAGVRGKSWLALLGAFAAMWALSFLYFAMAPFGGTVRWGVFISINVRESSWQVLTAFAVITIVQIAALFAASGALLEKKLNLA